MDIKKKERETVGFITTWGNIIDGNCLYCDENCIMQEAFYYSKSQQEC